MVNIAEKIRQESSTITIQGFLPSVTTFSVSVCYHGGVNLLPELLQTQFSNNSLLLLFSVYLFVFLLSWSCWQRCVFCSRVFVTLAISM